MSSDISTEDLAKVKRLLNYFFDDIHWRYQELTPAEKRIIQDRKTLERLKEFADEKV